MREAIVNMWNSVMNADVNPLKNIPSLQARHMILQILAWTWASSFALAYGSLWIWGFSMIAHLCIIAAIVVTVATFETAKRKPATFNLRLEQGTVGYHSPGRSRQYMWVNGEKVKLDDRDPGGEHE